MADDDMDFYELLEIDEDASQDEVKEAFRSKVREYHPDLNDDPDAPAQFNALKKAYETLNDSSERNAYDRLGHRDYVAKRIGGFPSGDIWRSSDSGDSGGSTSRSVGSSTRSGPTGRSSGSGRGSSRSTRGSSSQSSATTTNSSTPGEHSTTGATGTSSSSRSTGASAAGTSTGGRRSSTGHRSTRSGGATVSGGWTDNALFNWWNGLNLGWPLMLSAVLLYLAGLVQYGLAYATGLSTLTDRLAAAGTDVGALQAAVTESRYGLPQPATFVTDEGALVTEPPLPSQQWYGALAALVGVTVLAFALNRAFRARRPYKWVTINETVGVSAALAVAAGAVGGPLLAGAVVMPLVYLVIIRHTRMAFQFKPTYLYVVGVSAPLLGLVLDLAGAAPMLAVDLAVAVLPLVSVVALLLSAFVRPKVAALF